MKKLLQNTRSLRILLFFAFFGIYGLGWAQIFITEIADPNNESGARYVELYNAGSTDVDLSTGWDIQRWTNGNASPQSPKELTGIIAAGGFYIVCNNQSTFTSVYGFAADQSIGTGGPADSNGDDQIALRDPSDTIVDMFGVVGEDGSNTNHEFEDGRAERKATVSSGNTTYTFSEWNIWNDTGDAGTTNSPQSAPSDFDPGQWIGLSSSGPTIGFDHPTSNLTEGNSGNSSGTAAITMNMAPDSDVMIDITFADGTATTADNDYAGTVATITFPASGTYPMSIDADYYAVGDTTVEPDEDFTVNIAFNASNTGNATLTTTTHTVTIVSDDSYNQCFTDDDDFEKVAITTNSDGDVWTYNAGTYSMNGYNGGNSEESNQWLILGDLDLSTYDGSEVLQLVLDATEQYSGTDLTVYITDTYTGCPDDVGNSWTTLGTITATGTAQAFDMSAASGSGSVYIGIQYLDDDGSYSGWDLSNIAIETDSATCFTINAPMASTCVTLPTVGFDIASSSVTEGDAGTATHNVAVTMDIAPSANTSLDVVSSENTATEGTDYVAVSSTITFLTTDTYPKTIQVPVTINGDTDIENNEDFDLVIALANGSENLANLGTDTHNVTITNDDSNCPNPGDLIFSEIMQNPHVVTDSNGEWFEIYNTTASPIDMQNMILQDDATTSETHTIATSLIVPANGYVVFTLNGDFATNGGINSDYTYDSISLSNGTDGIRLLCGGTEIDAVIWDDGNTFPDPDGKSMSLRNNLLNSNDNDSGYSWCEASSTYGDGDKGTPGAPNDDCGCNNLEVVTWTAGAWSNTTGPTAAYNTVIDDTFSTSSNGNFETCSCRVYSGNTLTVNANGYFKTEEDIINNGTITVENTGSVVQVNDEATVTGSGTFKVNVNTTPLLDTDRFTYFSSPSTGNNLDVFSWANQAYMWSFDGTTQNWHYEASPASVVMNAAQGYIVQDNNTSDTANGDQEPTIFNGAFNNGVFTQPMYYQVAGAPDSSDSSNALVGNPYPSAIDSDKLFTANPQLSGIYIWNHDSPLGNTYGDWANNDYIVCASGNACTDAPSGGPNATHNGYIATGQGFFATANAASPTDLVFNNAMRVAGNNDQFHRTPSEDRMWINLTDSTIGYYSQTLFRFTSNGNENLNNQYDALRLGSNYGLSFYSITNDTNDKLAIEDRGLFADDITIPVGYTVNNPAVTELTFSIDHFQNLEGVNVYLKDNLLNITHDLKLADYTFGISTTGEVNDRFELFFSRNALATTDFEVSKDRLVVSNPSNSQIKVNMLDGSVITNFKAYNTLGKLVINTNANSNSFVINTTLKRGQIVFIKATLENGQILKKKFIKL